MPKEAGALETARVSCLVSKCHELWSINGLKLNRSFYPPSLSSAFYFIIRLHSCRLANGTQSNVAKR